MGSINSSTTGQYSIEENNSSSSIIEAAVIVGFIVLSLSGLTLFLKITKAIRSSRERKRIRIALGVGARGFSFTNGENRFDNANDKSGGGKGKGIGSRSKVKNAFEEIEWEGVPVRARFRASFIMIHTEED